MDNYLKTTYRFFKENLTVFALVPTALGGIWQIFKLGFISINMIRFFSVSQLISDGIIILLIIFFPMFIYALPFVRSAVNQKKKGTNLFNKDLFLAHFIFIIFELILVLGVIFCFEIYTYINIDNLSILLQRIHILYVALIVLYFLISKFLKDEILLQLTFILLAMIFVSITVISFNNISKNLNDVENFQHLIKTIQKEEKYSKAPQILYFNDQYIFIELEVNTKKSILIKKVDDLF